MDSVSVGVLIVAMAVAVVVGLLIGRAVGARSARASLQLSMERARAQAAQELAIAQAELAPLQRDVARLEAQANAARDQQGLLSGRLQEALAAATRWQTAADGQARQLAEAGAREQILSGRIETLQQQMGELNGERSRLETQLQAERASGVERLAAARHVEQERLEAARLADVERQAFVAAAQKDMTLLFQKAAADILEEKTKRFTDHNRVSMEQLLTPLREKLGEFQGKVETLQQDGLVGRTELKQQIESLRGLNEKLSTDANNLVKALKNSSKQQGDWGEVLLVGMLEDAGLRAGQEYGVQTSFANEDGRQSRPDIILNLPDDKHLVIDSKVSLTSYAEYCACEDEGTRKVLLERHVSSMRGHIDSLNRKSYQNLHQLNSLDFVVMFVPIEPAYLLAMAHDGGLWQRAWNKDVLLVSPGTLFPVIRTIAHMWQQEKQSKNVEEILEQAGNLYDKVATFAGSFEEVGKRLDGARTAYDKAFGQLASGKGNVLGRITKLKSLGLATSKKMPAAFVADELEDGEPMPGVAELDGKAELLALLPGLAEPGIEQ
jgi:DNA recombination protein RmuC